MNIVITSQMIRDILTGAGPMDHEELTDLLNRRVTIDGNIVMGHLVTLMERDIVEYNLLTGKYVSKVLVH